MQFLFHKAITLHMTNKNLLDMQDLLCASLSPFISFEGHALYFPTTGAPEEPQLLARERKLLLPLFWQGKRLAVLMLHKVQVREIRRALHLLPAIAALCLENLARTRAQSTDPATGCLTQQALRQSIAAEMAVARTHLDNPAQHGQNDALHRLFMGLIVVPCIDGPALDAQIGYTFTDRLMQELANACLKDLPSDVLVARIGRHKLALLCTTTTTNCGKLATAVLERMERVSLKNPTTERPVKPSLAAGYVLYPRDVPAASLKLSFGEQAHILLETATLVSRVAQPGAVLSHSHVLRDGGRVLDILPKGRVNLNLGSRMGISLGQRFALFGRGSEGASLYKGELVIVQVHEESAIAETSYLEDAAILPAQGDTLVLQETLQKTHNADTQQNAPEDDEILSQHDFLVRYALERDRAQTYTLVLLRLGPVGEALAADEAESAVHRAIREWREHFGQQSPLAFVGQRGKSTFIAFHPGEQACELQPHYAALCARLQEDNVPCAAGLAPYPFLAFNRNEIQDCAFKALEYAQLLPAPHAGVCDSLALNISADRLYSLGDIFAAIDEYKLALLADKDNAMAWNSLGICMAALGKPLEAQRHFREGLRHKPDPVRAGQISYNMGTVFQNLGERRSASHYYHQCLKHDPEHVFAWIRLGQMREQVGRRSEAKFFYEKAAAIEDAKGLGNLAKRHLAGIAARQRKGDEARELLQEILRRDPNDAATMLLLAKIYLDGNEDPAMAEFLARKSVGLHDRPDAWQTLARALRALGREDEACLADSRAMQA